MVTILPNQGAKVASLDIVDVPQLLEALELSARAAGRWAALRHTPEDLQLIEARSHDFKMAARDRYEMAARDGDFSRMTEANKAFHDAISYSCGNKHIADHCSTLLAKAMRLTRVVFAKAPHIEEERV
jgi:DNA-binding GntR family transcriptional regulator